MTRLAIRIGRLVSGTDLPRRWAWAVVIVVFLSLGSLLAAAALTKVRNNPGSRLASIETLVDYRNWSIDRAIYRYITTDKVRVGSHFYSSKPPVYSVIGAVVYTLVKAATGWRMSDHERPVIFLLRLLLQIVPFALGLVVAGRFLRPRVTRHAVWFWGFTAFALGTFVFGYSATINNHTLAALLLLTSFAGAVRLASGGGDDWSAAGVGLTASLAVTFDFGTAVFALTLPLYLLGRARWRHLALLLLAALIPAIVHFHLTYRLGGGFLPFYSHPELYHYRGSYWNHPRDFDALHEPLWLYAFQSLLGHHGLLSMTPIFFLAIPGLWRLVRRRDERRTALWAGFVVLVTVGVYIVRGPHNYGGTDMGMRWFIAVAPLLWYLALGYADLRADRRWLRVLLPILVVIGVFHAAAALPNPWWVSPWNWLFRSLGLDSVPPYNSFWQ